MNQPMRASSYLFVSKANHWLRLGEREKGERGGRGRGSGATTTWSRRATYLTCGYTTEEIKVQENSDIRVVKSAVSR